MNTDEILKQIKEIEKDLALNPRIDFAKKIGADASLVKANTVFIVGINPRRIESNDLPPWVILSTLIDEGAVFLASDEFALGCQPHVPNIIPAP